MIEENAKFYYTKRIYCPNPALLAADDKIVKVAIFDPHDVSMDCQRLTDYCQKDFQMALAGKNWLDLMNPKVNKGEAMKFLQRYLNINPEECMAFGDYLNDRELLKNVHFSYAMANGHPELKAVAKFIAPANTDDGVMKILRGNFDFL